VQFVEQADVGEGAAHHHLVVAAACTLGIEVFAGHSPALELRAGGSVLGDVACGADVVGGNRVAQVEEAVRTRNLLDDGQLFGQLLEEGRVIDLGALLLPLLAGRLGGLKRVPAGRAKRDFLLNFAEHV